LSLESAVCCQVEVSATGRSPVQSNHTECGVPECDSDTFDNKATTWRVGAVASWGEKIKIKNETTDA
jgi:hypothetical protein